MHFEIATFTFYTFFCLFSVLRYGIIFSKIIYNPSEKNIGELGIFGFFILHFISESEKRLEMINESKFGAGEGIRTLDFNGKVAQDQRAVLF